MLRSCCFLMDRHTLLHRFRYITSLASLAYTFTTLHAIQYSMRDHDDSFDDIHDNNNNTVNTTSTQATALSAQTPQDNDSTNPSAASASTYDTPTTTSMSETIEKTSGRWTDNEIRLLLDYVEEQCTLTTARGLNLKKSDFNKARTTVKSKDASQCHYKWAHVCISSFDKRFFTYPGFPPL
jgi:hypothetical protein